MAAIISIPLFGILTILQSAVVSRLPLIQGTADLVLVVLVAICLQKNIQETWQWSLVAGLFVDFLSGLPFGVFTATYLAAGGLATLIRQRIWRFSFLMQLLVVLAATLLNHGLSYLILFLEGANLPFVSALQSVTLPSILLSFMLSIPVYILTQDVFDQINPAE